MPHGKPLFTNHSKSYHLTHALRMALAYWNSDKKVPPRDHPLVTYHEPFPPHLPITGIPLYYGKL